ncbi:hypothetical protein U9M48_018453 [Paspalum notatum var. saurae]|uniref:Endonuclease/exonuclease/phosphatase domain-containing protein n=1 Tax=Paspalum notatum var. saurae TaxID=547442 RepID=A0AAQ3TA19_PASNO
MESNHEPLARVFTSTKAKVIFISETRKQNINIDKLKSKLSFDHAHIVPSVGLSRGLWLLWNDDFNLNVISTSPNYILAEAIYLPSASRFSLVCIYGDPHHSRTYQIWQNVLSFVVNYPNTPVLCMGDMNNIMNAREKLGPNPANCARISNFSSWIKECGPFSYHGPAYTWTNKRFSSYPTFERLDRCFANAEWTVLFPNTSVHHLPMLYSDHCPILTTMDSPRQKEQTPTLHNHRSQALLIQQHHDIMQKNEDYHRQRVKKIWVTMGDRNTTIFPKDGNYLTTNEQMAWCFKSYFINLFTSQLSDFPQQAQGPNDLLETTPITDAFTGSTPTAQETWSIVKDMRSDAAQGPDGFNAAYLKMWYNSSTISTTQQRCLRDSTKPTLRWSQKAFMLKIELAKAFDRIEWRLILKALHKRGFSDHFCRMIHECLSTSSFSDAMSQGHLNGITLGRNCPPIHSLMFANDLIVCGQTTLEEVNTIKQIIDSFCNASGHTLNWAKSSIMFNKLVTQQQKNMATPFFLLINQTAAYNFILNKFRSKLTGLKADTLSHVGHLVYINSVLASIPIYYMTNILFPKDFLGKITSIIRNFWWKENQQEGITKPICFRAWEDICQSKHMGGLGIKNISMSIKVW